MDVTISIDDDTLARARSLAQRQGLSLQELLRRLLQSLAGKATAAETAAELMALLQNQPGNSGGLPWSRGDAYDRRS